MGEKRFLQEPHRISAGLFAGGDGRPNAFAPLSPLFATRALRDFPVGCHAFYSRCVMVQWAWNVACLIVESCSVPPRMIRLFLILAVLFAGPSPPGRVALGQNTPLGSPTTPWPSERERVKLVDGREYEGLIESVDDAWIHLFHIQRPNGRPMFLVIRPIERSRIASLKRLEPDQRAELRRHIDRFVNRARIEAIQAKAIELGSIDRDGTDYRRYRGKWFDMETTLDEERTRRAIVRAEQIFTAYRQILPPRVESRRPLRLVVLDSVGEYQTYLARMGIQIQNPACFLPDDNLVVMGSDVSRFAAQLEEIDARHDRLRGELETLEKRLPDRLVKVGRRLQQNGTPQKETAKLLLIARRKFEIEIAKKRQELLCCDRENRRLFENADGQMFRHLYHEAFHAYLKNYVIASRHDDVPRWLNEGLAVVFEAGLLDSYGLRIDTPNRKALRLLRADLKSERPLSLGQLLEAKPAAFLVDDGANRYYAHAWGLVYYLTFEKHLLSPAALEPYAARDSGGATPAQRFEQLVAMPIDQFERAWHQYITQLK